MSSMQVTADGALTRTEVRELLRKIYECNKCGEIFSQKLFLNHHKESVHEGKKPHKCKWCNASFFRESELRPHMDRHFFSTDPDETSFQSNEHGEIEIDSGALNENKENFELTLFQIGENDLFNEDGMLTITEVRELLKKMHECDKCGEFFSQKLCLTHHKELVHEGKKPHKCKWCNASFFRESELRPHIDKHFFSTDPSYFGRCMLSECKFCDDLG